MFVPTATNKKFVNNANVGSFVQIDGSNIHYISKGSGEAILLLHGIGQSFYTWRNNFNELSAKYKVIALDFPGFGCSEYIDMEYYPDEVAGFLRKFMDAVGVRHAHVVAFSTASLYALAFAQKHPTMVDRIVLISPGALPEKGISTWSNMLLSGAFTKMALSMLTRKRLKRMLYESYFDKTCLTDEIIDQHYCFMASKEQRENIFFAMATLDPGDITLKIRDLKNHVLVVAGGDDPWRAEEEIEEFSIPFHNVYVSITRNCGHMMHEEKAAKFNQSVIEFLEWNLKMPMPEEE